jgi:hypothetical protein
VAVFADYYRVGAQDEFMQFFFRQLAVIEYVPAGTRSAIGLGAFQFDALKSQVAAIGKRRRIRRPNYVILPVNVPVVALAADKA